MDMDGTLVSFKPMDGHRMDIVPSYIASGHCIHNMSCRYWAGKYGIMRRSCAVSTFITICNSNINMTPALLRAENVIARVMAGLKAPMISRSHESRGNGSTRQSQSDIGTSIAALLSIVIDLDLLSVFDAHHLYSI